MTREELPETLKPARWSDIKGHAAVREKLIRIIAAGRTPQAMLFFGTDGIGKRAVAEAVARSLLCTDPRGGLPCGGCRSCRAADFGTHPDFHFVVPTSTGKAARSIKIETVRELTREISRAPLYAPRRVVIVDDANLMAAPAANSLLKTIEEPPGEMVFILVTSARQAILPTIVSRCMLLPFSPLTADDVKALLAARRAPEPEAAEAAALSGGSAGRAIRLAGDEGRALRDDAENILSGIDAMDVDGAFREGERLGSLDREVLGEWMYDFRTLLAEIAETAAGSRVPDARTGRFAMTGARAIELLEISSESEKRLLTSNASTRLAMESMFIKMIG